MPWQPGAQSAGQLVAVSPLSQLPSPQYAGQAPQSSEHVLHVSPEQMPSPQFEIGQLPPPFAVMQVVHASWQPKPKPSVQQVESDRQAQLKSPHAPQSAVQVVQLSSLEQVPSPQPVDVSPPSMQ